LKPHWIISLLERLTDSALFPRQWLWRKIYNQLISRDKAGDFLFMNYGYEDPREPRLELKNSDETYRYSIQLYHHVVQDVDLTNKSLVEVGCGRGGGASFFVRYKNPRSYIGIDLSDQAIKWGQSLALPNSQWLRACATTLPLADNSIDVLINVESSHCYPSMAKFLQEVKRVLKPNGYLAYCDMRRLAEIEQWEKDLHHCGLKVLKQQEITSQALRTLDQTSSLREAQIRANFPKFLHRTCCDFGGIKNAEFYNRLKTGQVKYYSYLMQK